MGGGGKSQTKTYNPLPSCFDVFSIFTIIALALDLYTAIKNILSVRGLLVVAWYRRYLRKSEI